MKFALASYSSLVALCLGILVWSHGHALAGPPTTADKAKVVGQPISLEVQPPSITLIGPRSMQQLVVTGRYADGSVRDLTACVGIQAEGLVGISDEQVVLPLKSGTTNL